jgi:hypothetical protein
MTVTTSFDKPLIYWRRYKSLKRGFWRVSPRPRRPTNAEHYAWKFAHVMCAAMNRAEDDRLAEILAAKKGVDTATASCENTSSQLRT